MSDDKYLSYSSMGREAVWEMELLEYAQRILDEQGYDRATYGFEYGGHVFDDLMQAYPEGMDYPYFEVGKAILFLSKHRQGVRPAWLVTWTAGEDVENISCESYDDATDTVFDILRTWRADAINGWVDFPNPTEHELNNYNQMIRSRIIGVKEYVPKIGQYVTVWIPNHDVLRASGWHVLTWEDIRRMKRDYRR